MPQNNDIPWLQGIYDWYEDSPMDQWGRDIQQNVLNPLLAGAANTAMGNFTSGLPEAKAVAQLASGVPDALWKGAQTAAVAPYAYKQGGLEGSVNAIEKIWNAPGMQYQAPPESETFLRGAETLAKPFAEAPAAVGDALYEATGLPSVGAAGQAMTAGAEMLLPNMLLRKPRQLGVDELFPDPRALEGPRRAPVNPKDPTGKQRGSVKVVDPDAEDFRGMFEAPTKKIPPVMSSRAPNPGPQPDMFPLQPEFKSVIPEAVERLTAKYGEKDLPAKLVAQELQSSGVQPQELDMYGVGPWLEDMVDQGYEIRPSDTTDAMNENELQVVTGGEGVIPAENPLFDEADAPEIQAATQNITDTNKKITNITTEMKDWTRTAASAGGDIQNPDRNYYADRQAAEDVLSHIKRMAHSKPDDWTRTRYIDEVDKTIDKLSADAMPASITNHPEYPERLAKLKKDFKEALDENVYWRDELKRQQERFPAAGGLKFSGTSAEGVSDALASSDVQDALKYPNTLSNEISVLSMPQRMYGDRKKGASHFPSPAGYTGFGHLRKSQRPVIPKDDNGNLLYDYWSDMKPGTVLPTTTHLDERQFDFHRMAQGEHGYEYGRDLTPVESRKADALSAEKNLLAAKRNDPKRTDDQIAQDDARINEIDDAIHTLIKVTAGPAPDLPYKERVNQTTIAIKNLLLDAVARGDEFVTIASPRQQAEVQGSGEGYQYVEDVRWNPEDKTWDVVGGSGYEHVPTIEMKRHFTDEQMKEAKDSVVTKEAYNRERLLFDIEENPELATSIIEDRDGHRLAEGYGYQIPEYYYSDPAAKAKLDRSYYRQGTVIHGDELQLVGELINEAMPDEDIDAVVAHVAKSERPVIWGHTRRGHNFVSDIGSGMGQYADLDDYAMQEAEKYVRDDDPDNRVNTMSPNQLSTYVDDDMYDEDISEGFGGVLGLNDDVIMDSSVAGAAANYEDSISIPAIKRIYRELGLGEYKPQYQTIPIAEDMQYASFDDHEGSDYVLSIPVTPQVEHAVRNQLSLFNELNDPPRSREERRRASMKRRAENPDSLLYSQSNVADMAPFKVGESDLGQPIMRGADPSLFTELPSDRLRGLPETIYVPGKGEKKYGNYQPVVDSAKKYVDSIGMPYNPPSVFAPLDESRAKRIAAEYERMEDNPNDPLVKRAYKLMADETMAQYEQMLADGIEVDFNYNYNTPRDVIDDVIDNKHMSVFPTEAGYGVDTGATSADNPLLAKTDFKTSDGQPMVVNDLFRAVHDYYGHVKNGVGFRARGEEAAWQSHASMFSPLARRAMTTETRGQNSWVNYGPEAEVNRTASPEDTRYADQKIGLLPAWVSEEGRLSAKDRKARFQRARQANRTGFEGAIGDDGRVKLIHYSRAPISRTDPSLWGAGLSTSRTERNRIAAGAPGRTFYGIEDTHENPYRKERGLGSERNEASLHGELIYDIADDPDRLWDSSDIVESEKAIRDAGYSGYYRNHPKIGKVVAVFDELEVKPYEYRYEPPGNELFPESQLTGDDIFTVGTNKDEGSVPLLYDIKRLPDYFSNEKGIDMEIVHMSPDEYIRRAVETFGSESTIGQVVDQRMETPIGEYYQSYGGSSRVENIANAMKAGVKYEAPWLDTSNGRNAQEGLHRAMAAKMLGIDSIPVAVLTDSGK